MRFPITPTTAALAALVFAAPAAAQVAAPAAPGAPAAVAPPSECQAGITKGARNALVELQAAVNAKDAANIALKLPAAKAVAKSNDDRCFIAQMELKIATDNNNLAAVAPALEAQLASGSVPAAKIAERFEALGRAQYVAKNYAAAGTSLERALALTPDMARAVVMLGEVRSKQGRAADAVPFYRKAIALEKAAGRKASQDWYKRAVAVAYEARSPATLEVSRDWVAAYPSAESWRDSVGLYGLMSTADAGTMIDLWRLQRQTKSLKGESDHARYAQELLTRGYPGEAKAMLEEGIASGAVDSSRPSIKQLLALATSKSAGDRASLDSQAKVALAGGAAKPVMVLGDAYFGYGDYARSVSLYRAALGKSGVDANLANLRLGMALAASGDKPGAKAALALVSGPRAEVARYWITYVS